MPSEKTIEVDIAIVGGGMVGGALALALSDLPYRVALVDAQHQQPLTSGNYDERSTALSFSSQQLFSSLGVWSSLSKHSAAIEKIHVSQVGHLGAVRITAQEQEVPALGYVIPNRHIIHSLYQSLTERLSGVQLFSGATVQQVNSDDDGVDVHFMRNAEQFALKAKVLLAVDGSHSFVRSHLDVGVTKRDYQQTAVIANFTPGMPHQQQAFERFTASGPLAILPLANGCCNLVYTVWRDDAERVLGLSDAAFCREIESLFGLRLGYIQQMGARFQFPLELQQSETLVCGRSVFLGNAARTLHPVAGQGLNLGLRDVAEWRGRLVREAPADPGASSFLQSYAAKRSKDQAAAIDMTDFFARTFCGKSRSLGHVRGLGLMLMNALPVVKDQLSKRSMGVAGRLSLFPMKG